MTHLQNGWPMRGEIWRRRRRRARRPPPPGSRSQASSTPPFCLCKVCAPRPRLVDRKKVFFDAKEESLLGLAPALQEGAEAHATAPPLSGAVLAAFLPIAAPAPRPRRARAAPAPRLESASHHRAAWRPHSTFAAIAGAPELLQGRTEAQNIALLALSNFAGRVVDIR